MKLSVKGVTDHLLHVEMEKDEELIARKNSFVSCQGALSIIGEFFDKESKVGITQKISNEIETKQRIISKGKSKIVLAPPTPGDIHIIECSEKKNLQFVLLEHSFFAMTKNIKILNEYSVIGKYSYYPTKGSGFIALSAFGDFQEITLNNDTIVVDDSHILAWSQELDMELIDIVTQNKLSKSNAVLIKDKGLDLTVTNGKLTGEDFLFKFSGTGKVIICTRNKHVFWEDLVNKF